MTIQAAIAFYGFFTIFGIMLMLVVHETIDDIRFQRARERDLITRMEESRNIFKRNAIYAGHHTFPSVD